MDERSKYPIGLKGMLQRQAVFQTNFEDISLMTDREMQQCIQQYGMLLMGEVFEVIGETSFRPHRATHELDEGKVREELIDCLKYLLCMMNVVGMYAEDIEQAFHKKSQSVEDQYYANVQKRNTTNPTPERAAELRLRS